jgi:hypothetical protein
LEECFADKNVSKADQTAREITFDNCGTEWNNVQTFKNALWGEECIQKATFTNLMSSFPAIPNGAIPNNTAANFEILAPHADNCTSCNAANKDTIDIAKWDISKGGNKTILDGFDKEKQEVLNALASYK